MEVKSIQSITEAPEKGILVTNPPYGERIGADDMEALYKSIGDAFKKVFKGYNAWVISLDNEIFDFIGLKPSIKFPILNGSLECDLREYVIFDGRYNDLRKEGGHIKNKDFKGEAKPEYRKVRFEETFNRGDRKERGKSRFDRAEKPKNALEERYRKPFPSRGSNDDKRNDFKGGYGRREGTAEKRGERTEDAPRRSDGAGRPHGKDVAEKIVQFRKPTLGSDMEQPIVKGSRRNGWKRKDLDKKED